MEIVSDEARAHADKVLELLNRFLEKRERDWVIEIAQVLRKDGLTVLRQTNGALLRPPNREHRRSAHGQKDGLGNESASTAHRTSLPGDDADHRVVGARMDLAVVQEKGVGDRRQPDERVLV